MKAETPVFPIKGTDTYKYSITYQESDEEGREVGAYSDQGFLVEDEIGEISDIVREAHFDHGIYSPVASGVWESVSPTEDADYFEKGIHKYYTLHLTNKNGEPVTQEEHDFITALMNDGNVSKDETWYGCGGTTKHGIGGIIISGLLGAFLGYGAGRMRGYRQGYSHASFDDGGSVLAFKDTGRYIGNMPVIASNIGTGKWVRMDGDLWFIKSVGLNTGDVTMVRAHDNKMKIVKRADAEGLEFVNALGGQLEAGDREKHNKLVAREGDTYYFVDDIFKHDDNFMGATATVIVPVSAGHYEDATSRDGLYDRYIDAVSEEEWEEMSNISQEDSEDWHEEMKDWFEEQHAYGQLEPFEDAPYFVTEQMREKGFSEDEYPMFEVIGGGRSFSQDDEFDEVYDQELLDRIRLAEGKKLSRGGSTYKGGGEITFSTLAVSDNFDVHTPNGTFEIEVDKKDGTPKYAIERGDDHRHSWKRPELKEFQDAIYSFALRSPKTTGSHLTLGEGLSMEMPRKIKIAIEKYGKEKCIEAYNLHEEGMGGRGVGDTLGVTTNQADAMINCGRYLATGDVYDHGGQLPEGMAEIYINDTPYFVKKHGDSTHFYINSDKEWVQSNHASVSHIGQAKGEEFYEDVRSWLQGGASPHEKRYTSTSGYYEGGGQVWFLKGVGKSGLDKIKKHSKENKDKLFIITDDNYSNIGHFWLKNGKFARKTVANPHYDLQNSKTTLRAKGDVIYKIKEYEADFSEGGNVPKNDFFWDNDKIGRLEILYPEKPTKAQALKDMKTATSKYREGSEFERFTPVLFVVYPYLYGWDSGYKAYFFTQESAKKHDQQINGHFFDEVKGSRKVYNLKPSEIMQTGGEVISDGGNYLNISATKDRMVITPDEDTIEYIRELREDGHGDDAILSELFEDIQANSELLWHYDLGQQGFGLTSASGVTDGYYYDDDGEFTDKGRSDSRVYYFSDYMLRSELDDMIDRGQLILTGADNKYAGGGELRLDPQQKKAIRSVTFDLEGEDDNRRNEVIRQRVGTKYYDLGVAYADSLLNNGGSVEDMFALSLEYADKEEWMIEALKELRDSEQIPDLRIERITSSTQIEIEGGDDSREYVVFKDEDLAETYAQEYVSEMLEENPEYFTQDWLMQFVDKDKAESFFREVYEEWDTSYARDILSESGQDYENRLIDEMVERGLMTDEEASSEEASEIAEDRIDTFAEAMTEEKIDEGNGGYDHYKFNFGEEQAGELLKNNNLLDVEGASEEAVNVDGIGHFLSGYDGEQIDLPTDAVAYRTN